MQENKQSLNSIFLPQTHDMKIYKQWVTQFSSSSNLSVKMMVHPAKIKINLNTKKFDFDFGNFP